MHSRMTLRACAASLLSLLLAGSIGCDEPASKVTWSEKEASINAIYLEVEGIGGIPLPKRGWYEVPYGTRVTIRQMKDYVLDDRITRRMKRSKKMRSNDHPEKIVSVETVPFEVGDTFVVTGEGEGLGFWAYGPEGHTEESPGYSRSLSFKVAPATSMNDAYEAWTLVIDRRNEEVTHGLFTAQIRLPDAPWPERDLRAMNIHVRKSSIGLLDSVLSSTFFLDRPLRSVEEQGMISPRFQVTDAFFEQEDGVLDVACEFSMNKSDGRLTAFLPINLSTWRGYDPENPDEDFMPESLGIGDSIRMPDWTTPMLRFSEEEPEGVPMTSEEIEAFDAEKTQPMTHPLDP